jgi:hypothetical protein
MLPTKKAARRTPEAATTNQRRTPTYTPTRTSSRRFCRQFFPGRRDRAPAQPPTRGTASVGDALSLLLLGLQRADLTPNQRRRGWKLAERWLGEFVEARLVRGAA